MAKLAVRSTFCHIDWQWLRFWWESIFIRRWSEISILYFQNIRRIDKIPDVRYFEITFINNEFTSKTIVDLAPLSCILATVIYSTQMYALTLFFLFFYFSSANWSWLFTLIHTEKFGLTCWTNGECRKRHRCYGFRFRTPNVKYVHFYSLDFAV